MTKYWWTVWIKVAVMAVVLIFAYNLISGFVRNLFKPYLLEETGPETSVSEQESDEEDSENGNPLITMVNKVEQIFNIEIDYENMLFDYANEYAQAMMEGSKEDRNAITEHLDD